MPILNSQNDAVAIAPSIHKIVFENEKVRVLDVIVKPGEKAEMHWHPENIVYIQTGGKLRFTKPDGSVMDVGLVQGKVTAQAAGFHAVENIGATEVHVIQVELKI